MLFIKLQGNFKFIQEICDVNLIVLDLHHIRLEQKFQIFQFHHTWQKDREIPYFSVESHLIGKYGNYRFFQTIQNLT